VRRPSRRGAGSRPAQDKIGHLNETRRLFVRYTLASVTAVAVAAVAGFELISRGVLPGKVTLDELDGTCSVDGPDRVRGHGHDPTSDN
jgi:hypothetical protein